MLDLEDLIPAVVAIAREAGSAILDIYQQPDFDTTTKTDHSPLTAADLASHRLIIKALTSLTPQIPILSEESPAVSSQERQQWSEFWLVDPLDGTKEFVQRNGQFTVNIAYIRQGVPILGVVYAPVLETFYWGTQTGGAFKQTGSEPITRIITRPYPEPMLKVVASRSHSSPETEAFLNKLARSYGEIDLISMGSSLKFCLIADGSAHLYPRFAPTMEWDTAAAQCVIEAAGGKVTTLSGDALRYNKLDLHNPFFMAFSGSVAQLWPSLT